MRSERRSEEKGKATAKQPLLMGSECERAGKRGRRTHVSLLASLMLFGDCTVQNAVLGDPQVASRLHIALCKSDPQIFDLASHALKHLLRAGTLTHRGAAPD